MNDSFAIRKPPRGVRRVRHSKFVIRNCPAPHNNTGRFDFVLANPPFNVNAVDVMVAVRNRVQPVMNAELTLIILPHTLACHA